MRRLLTPILICLLCLSCLRTERFAAKFDLSLGNSQFLAKIPRQEIIELPKGEFWHNSFILKNGNREVFCATEILANNLDQSIKKIKITWIAKKIEVLERREYQLYECIRNRKNELKNDHLVDQVKIKELNDSLSLIISSKGLTELANQHKVYELKEAPLLINLKSQKHYLNTATSQLQIIEQNLLYSEVLIENTTDNAKYSSNYLIFNTIGLICLNSRISLHTDEILTLIEPFSLTLSGTANVALNFYGWDKLLNKLSLKEKYLG